MASFSKKEAIKYGWEEVKKNPWKLILAAVIVMGVPYAANWILQMPVEAASAGSDELTPTLLLLIIATTIVSFIINIIFSIGAIKFALAYYLKKNPDNTLLYTASRNEFINYTLGSILYGLIVLGGVILLIIPGIIFAIKYQYYSYLIIDKGLKPIEAIKKSGHMTQGHKWNLFLFGFLMGLIAFLGFLTFIVGLVVAYPVIWLAQAYVYNKLLHLKEAK